MSKNKAATAVEPSKARVLCAVTVNGVQYQPDDLIEAEAEVIAGLGGSVDPHPDAVAYCEGLING